jgi:TAP-like protein
MFKPTANFGHQVLRVIFRSQVRRSNVETLLVGGELDLSTPPQIMTKELLPYLPNGQQVVLSGVGHTGSFFAVQPSASSRLINTFSTAARLTTRSTSPRPSTSRRSTASAGSPRSSSAWPSRWRR